MAELNQVFIFSKDLHIALPLEEGKQSIYGVRASYMFNDNMASGRIFQRDTYGSTGQASQRRNDGGPGQQNEGDPQGYSGLANGKLSALYQNTKSGMSKVGEKLGIFQGYLITVSIY
jgi:hypothetical protein